MSEGTCPDLSRGLLRLQETAAGHGIIGPCAGSALSSRVVVPAVVLVIAAGLRLWGLGTPDQLYGDESYYVFDAAAYLGGGIVEPIGDDPPRSGSPTRRTWVHPPLGKWIIALLGIGPLGQRPIGWRLPSAVFGIVGVALLYLLALRLWRSVWWAGVAALLLALDGLHIVQSRIAMLDIFLTTFITAAVLFLVLDRERMAEAASADRWRRISRLFGSPFRLWAGVFAGMCDRHEVVGCVRAAARRAVSAPSGRSPAIAAAIDRVGDRRDADGLVRPGPAGGLPAQLRSVLLPARARRSATSSTLQSAMLRYQQAHLAIQPENSAPWTWPLLLHPVRYFRAESREVARPAPSWRSGTRSCGGDSCCCFRSRSSRSSVEPRGRTRSSSAATRRCSFRGSSSGGRSSSGTCCRPSRSCAWASPPRSGGSPPARRGTRRSRSSARRCSSAPLFIPVWTGWFVPSSWIRALAWLPDWPM